MLASSLAALCAGRGFRLLFLGTHKMLGDICSAPPGVWLQQKPEEVGLLVLRKPSLQAQAGRAKVEITCVILRPAFQRHSSVSPGFGDVPFPSYEAEWSSLINSVHSALITLNKGWQLSDVSSAD